MCLHMSSVCVHTGLCVYKRWDASVFTATVNVLIGAGVCKENVAQGNAE